MRNAPASDNQKVLLEQTPSRELHIGRPRRHFNNVLTRERTELAAAAQVTADHRTDVGIRRHPGPFECERHDRDWQRRLVARDRPNGQSLRNARVGDDQTKQDEKPLESLHWVQISLG